MFICAISPWVQDISKKLKKKLGLIFNFRGGYDMKNINSRTFFTASLKNFFWFMYICAISLWDKEIKKTHVTTRFNL